LEDFTFPSSVTHTFINGNLIYACPDKFGENGAFDESNKGMRLKFSR
jgi:dihydroorotase